VPRPDSLAFVAVAAIALFASSGSAQVVCTTPDGKVHAGTRIPKGCTVKDKYRGLVDPGQPPLDPAASALRSRQAEIRREADGIAGELRAIDARLAAVPDFEPSSYANNPADWQAYDRDLAARDAAIERLRRRESELRSQLGSLKRELARDTAASR